MEIVWVAAVIDDTFMDAPKVPLTFQPEARVIVVVVPAVNLRFRVVAPMLIPS
jgi:hypothetical protein